MALGSEVACSRSRSTLVIALLIASFAPRASAQGACTLQTASIAPGQTLTGDLDPEDCVHNAQTNSRYDA
jgi:hypothetical protein